jgi:hypothetical protein
MSGTAVIFWLSIGLLFYTYIGYGIVVWCTLRLRRLFTGNRGIHV